MDIYNDKNSLTDGDRKTGTILAYLYLFFMYVRPQEYIPGMTLFPTSGVIFALLSVWGLFHLRASVLKSPVIIVLILGVIFVVGGIGLVNVVPYKMGFRYVTQLFTQCAAIYIIFDNSKRISSLINLMVVIHFFMALITIKNGGRGPGAFTSDENDAALALAMGLPFALYSLWLPDITRKQFWFRIGTVAIIVMAIIITSSRGGLLGLVATLLTVWWLGRKRIKYALIAVAVSVTMSGVIFAVLPDGYYEDMASMTDPNDDTKVERYQLWETAWVTYKHNPIMGVGVAQFAFRAGDYQQFTSWYKVGRDNKNYRGKVVHSVYFQILSETGTIGSLIYLIVFVLFPMKLYFSMARNDEPVTDPDEKTNQLLARILIGNMAAYCVSGAFIAVAYYPHIPIWIAVFAIQRRHFRNINDNKLKNDRG